MHIDAFLETVTSGRKDDPKNLKNLKVIKSMAGEHCQKCFGRGFDCVDLKFQAIICQCVIKKAHKVKSMEEARKIREAA
jgi:hypothetical protein